MNCNKHIVEPSQSSSKMSRRQMLHDAAVAAGGTALAVATLSVSANQARAAKMSQAAAGYQTAAHGGQSCANCALFQAPSSCSVVDGTVSPSGWCKLYAKKA